MQSRTRPQLDQHHRRWHKAAVQKLLALTIGTLLLAGCQARAGGDSKDDEAIYAAVKDVMCAQAADERENAVSRLADQIESYRAIGEDDSASGIVDASLDDLEPADCSKK